MTSTANRDRAAADRIKIWFRFVPREDWLPHDKEGLWATPAGSDIARIDTVPFLVGGVAQDDLVRFVTNTDGLHWATERVKWSGNNTIRVLPIRDGPLGPSASAVHEQFAPFGIGGEAYSAELPLVALASRPTQTSLRSRRCWSAARTRDGGPSRQHASATPGPTHSHPPPEMATRRTDPAAPTR